MTDNINNIILKNCEKIVFKDELLVSSLNYSLYSSTTCNHEWKTVYFGRTFIDPIVITSDPTFNGVQPATVRVRNVTPSSFEVVVIEPSNLDVIHMFETINYVVGERGTHITSNNKQIVFGSSNATPKTGNVNYNHTFSTKPVVLTQNQTYNNAGWMTVRTTNITTTNFEVLLQPEEKIRNTYVALDVEQVGWLAIETVNNDNSINCSETSQIVDHNMVTIDFNEPFSSPPTLIAKLSSSIGIDPANIRISEITNTNFTILVQEETTTDSETQHIHEHISYLAMDSNSNTL